MVKTSIKDRAGIAGESSIPVLFPFITLRQERFGALVYNPYFGMDVELDPSEAYFAGLCNGSNSFRRIERILKKRFNLTDAECLDLISRAAGKMSRVLALGYNEGKESARPVLPREAGFPGEGPYLSAPREVTWEVTYACNLRCPHCFTDSGGVRNKELDTGECLSLIDQLVDARVFSLLLNGGEPLLRPDILALLRRLSATGIRVDIGTNGVGVPDKILDRLREYRVSHVHVSIDGIGEKHDRFRGKKGAFDAACGTIQRLKERHMSVSISTTATAQNLDEIDDIIDLGVELGCKGFKAIPFFTVGRGRENEDALRLGPREYYRLCKTVVERRRELKGKLGIHVETCFPFLLDSTPKAMPLDGWMGCAAGYDTLCLGADGTLYPCPFLRDFSLGNIRGSKLADIWRTDAVIRSLGSMKKSDMGKPCSECHYAPVPCGGGCRAAAYLEHGDLKAVDPRCFKHLFDSSRRESS
jgi:radical SAM protein with 4Fe4S-binding SPASM domain